MAGYLREVRIHDTLSGELQSLRTDAEIGIYFCGPTVYSRVHIGNARPFVVFSVFVRWLRAQGYPVRLVSNITDINDKIYAAAATQGVASAAWAKQMRRAYIADTDALGLGRPDAEPCATQMVPEIIAMISQLIEAGHAYVSDGSVYFRVHTHQGHGKLSNRHDDQIDQNEAAEGKEAPVDFALWKAAKPGEDTSWPAPWGRGRPAWHIECSVMAAATLGDEFEIHGGGNDLIFPHHENEIAQSECSGHAFARLWMHNGMVQAGAGKMAKSDGNVFQLHQAVDEYGPEAVILYLLSGHYHQPLAFSAAALMEAAVKAERIRNFFRQQDQGTSADEAEVQLADFHTALADDFNTPAAFAILFELLNRSNRGQITGAQSAVKEMLDVLGLAALTEKHHAEYGTEAEELLQDREQARAAGDYARADQLRDQLQAAGWQIRDSADGPQLIRAADGKA